MTTRIKGVFALATALFSSITLTTLQPLPAAAASTWLDRLNAWRAATNLPALTENTTWDQGDYNHSLYMVKNDAVTHYEVSTMPYYTPEGDTAARNGNIQVSSTTSTGDDTAIDWWMGAPFHALGMMDPRLTSTGFGAYREVKSGWQAGFTLDTLRGNSFSGGTYPVFFPGNGSSVPLTQYSGNEWPDPLQACSGYTMPVGLPVFVQVGGNVATTAGAHTFTGNGTPLEHCVIDSNSPSVGSNLTGRGAVIVIPRQPLQVGVSYVVTLTVNNVPYTWTFGVSSNNSIVPCNTTANPGGVATSGPSASSWGFTRTDVFVKGQDNGVWQSTSNCATWSGWAGLGGVVTSRPGAVSWGPNRIDLFARGQDNGMWHKWSDGNSWSGWWPLGGVLTSGAGVSSWSSGRLDVFARGQDNGLWHISWNGSSWSGWQSLGGVLTSDPAAVSWGPNRIDIFARGQDNGLWHISWNGASWSGWQSLGGTLGSGPAASSCGYGHLDVFALGSTGVVNRLGFTGFVWTGWLGLTAQGTSDPAAVCAPGSGTVRVFERLGDNTVVQSVVAGT